MEIKANPVHPNAKTAKTKPTQAESGAFAQVLNAVRQSKPAQKVEAQPGALCRLTKPRSHLQLTSLNPVGSLHNPKPAALETIGESRILPFVFSTTR